MQDIRTNKSKRIAALTMVRNDDFFLQKWVEYYGAELGEENLYIYFDGEDQTIPPFCANAHAMLHPKIGTHVIKAEKGRLRFLSEKAHELMKEGYDMVIGVDADEYIVADPCLGMRLAEFLSSCDFSISLSALGLDVGQKLGEEGDLSLDSPFLSQRRYAQIGTRYTKPSIIRQPVIWGSGFHRIKGHNYHIQPHLYLFHFGYSDKRILEQRMDDKDRLSQGWGRHMIKRGRTIHYATHLPARPFDIWTRRTRICQTYVRSLFQWNKPAMFEAKIVVEIPERFRHIL